MADQVTQAANVLKVTDEQIAESYRRHGNVWRVAEELGVSGQTVSRRMRAGGIAKNRNDYSEADVARIVEYYTQTPASEFSLDALCAELGRKKTNLCVKARALGLTDKSRPFAEGHLAAVKASCVGRWDRHEHPRGFTGGAHSESTRQKMSQASRRHWSTLKTFFPEKVAEYGDRMAAFSSQRANNPATSHSRAKQGKREDLGDIHFRSSWEANYARFLNLLIKMKVVEWWQYEPRTFWFEGYKRGVMSYRPDFLVKYRSDVKPVWVEVKGWEVPKDRVKWKRFAKQYPGEKLEIVGAKAYRAIASKWASAIPHWEGK